MIETPTTMRSSQKHAAAEADLAESKAIIFRLLGLMAVFSAFPLMILAWVFTVRTIFG